VHELDVPAGPFHQSPDRRLTHPAHDQVTFPMPGDGAVFGVLGSVIDEPARVDVAGGALVLASARLAQGAVRAQLLG